MKNIKFISFILLFIAYDVNATSVKLFGRDIDIPNKYNLFVNESIEHNKFIFRTGDFISGTNNGLLEIITIGLVKDLLINENKVDIKYIEGIKKVDGRPYTYESKKNCIFIMEQCYIHHLYLDNINYILYTIVDVSDIDEVLLTKKEKK